MAAIPALRPDVVLMDINLPGMNGTECVARLARDLPDTHMIMITVYGDTDAIFDSLTAGAGGYLLKPVRSAQLTARENDVLELLVKCHLQKKIAQQLAIRVKCHGPGQRLRAPGFLLRIPSFRPPAGFIGNE